LCAWEGVHCSVIVSVTVVCLPQLGVATVRDSQWVMPRSIRFVL